MNKILTNNYYNPTIPGSYSGLETFYKSIKERGIKLEKEKIKNWLEKQPTYAHHYPVINKFKRNKIFVTGIDELWQIDLCDLSNISAYNEGNNFLITCIDVFSKYAWAIPIKKKSAQNVINGFKLILESSSKPKKIQSDEGKEFHNQYFKKFLQENEINLYKVNSELKACVVERFNRTLKEKMWRYFSHNNTYRYIDVLDNLLENYNNSFHRTIKCAPKEVNNSNEFKIWKKIYGLNRDATIKFKFDINDVVLISKDKGLFAKGYDRKWVREKFIIHERLLRYPPVYKIKDLNGEIIDGVFYEQNLQKIKF